MVTIAVQEIITQTIQGEGHWSGSPCDFIRLFGCPLNCFFCDTGYGAADNLGRDNPKTVMQVQSIIEALKSRFVVISGGEPFAQPRLADLVTALYKAGKEVAIETSGAFDQDLPITPWLTLSPKQHLNAKFPVHPLMWDRADEIKLVISTGNEVNFYRPHLPAEPDTPVYLQPEWNDRDRTIPLTLELLKRSPGYRLSLQTHKYIGVP